MQASPDYDARYARGWAYGKTASQVVRAFAANPEWYPDTAKPMCHQRVLSLGEGQGRNVTFLAQTLGVTCVALDKSQVGLSKAAKLAQDRSVGHLVETIACNVADFPFDSNPQWDVILAVYCPMDKESRAKALRQCGNALNPGGVVVVEEFSPLHAQVSCGQRGLGPQVENLLSLDDLHDAFPTFQVLFEEEIESSLFEGAFHRMPRAGLTRFIARKPSSRTTTEFPDPKFKSTMHAIYSCFSTRQEQLSVLDQRAPPPPPPSSFENSVSADFYLDNADCILKHTVQAAGELGVCMYCWFSCCVCSRWRLPSLDTSDVRATTSNVFPDFAKVHFFVLVHPCEFIRGSSTAKLLPWILNALGHQQISCDILFYGSEDTQTRLKKLAIAAKAPGNVTKIFYPDQGDDKAVLVDTFFTRCQETGVVASSDIAEKRGGEGAVKVGGPTGQQVLTVIVPDGSWACTKAMIDRLDCISGIVSDQRRPFLALPQSSVDQFKSPLIESLNTGSGTGRLSTAEAVSLLFDQVSASDVAEIIQNAVAVTATVFDQRKMHVRSLEHGWANNKFAKSFPKQFRAWVNAVSACSKADKTARWPRGMRWCPVCGAVLASAKRMPAHLQGKRHCEAIVHRLFQVEGKDVPMDQVGRVLKSYSQDVMFAELAWAAPDPVDVALSSISNW